MSRSPFQALCREEDPPVPPEVRLEKGLLRLQQAIALRARLWHRPETHQTTKLINRLGTNTTLRSCLPARLERTFSSISAAARTSSSPESAATRISARSFPFTWTA